VDQPSVECNNLQEKHASARSYTCPHCNKTFVSSAECRKHARVHTAEKNFKCSQCEMQFRDVTDLNEHMSVHNGDKLHKCSHCKKSFSKVFDLKVHETIHTGEKLFACPYCDEKFTHYSSRKGHIVRVHGEVTPYRCDHCGKCFKSTYYLKRHLQSHNSDKSFRCSDTSFSCDKTFSGQSDLCKDGLVHERSSLNSETMPSESEQHVAENNSADILVVAIL